MKIFLHVCCAIDEYVTLKAIENKNLQIESFFYNPNIFPFEEYIKRYRDVEYLSNIFKIPGISGNYDEYHFISKTKDDYDKEENLSRCEKCIQMRLEETAKAALEKNYKFYSSTLIASPKKVYKKIKEIGEKIGEKYKIEFFSENYKKNFPQSLARKQMKDIIYIQDYCGCIYGLINQKKKYIERDKRDLKNLYQKFFEHKSLWEFRGKKLNYNVSLPKKIEKLKSLLGIIKPDKLLINKTDYEKLNLTSMWLKCPGYNCKIEIRR